MTEDTNELAKKICLLASASLQTCKDKEKRLSEEEARKKLQTMSKWKMVKLAVIYFEEAFGPEWDPTPTKISLIKCLKKEEPEYYNEMMEVVKKRSEDHRAYKPEYYQFLKSLYEK